MKIPPGVNSTSKRLADGTRRKYYYHRDTGRRLRGEPGSTQFRADYADAERSFIDRGKGDLNHLIRDYTGSVFFKTSGKATTRAGKVRMLTKIEPVLGTMPIAALDDPRVRQVFMKYQDAVARESGLREADHRLTTLSAVLSWAVDQGKIPTNRLLGFKHLHKADRSDKIWLPEHIQGFMRVAPIEMQRALILALHTGQRQGDIRALSWNNYKDGWLSLRQGKTGRKVEIPCTAALRKMLAGLDRKASVILTTKTGLPWKARYFKRQWEEASLAAGIDDLHFNDLRGTAVTMLAEAGCTIPEVAAITGHSLKTVNAILEKYLSRTRHLAEAAIVKFQNAKTTRFANRLQTGPQKPKKGEAK